MVGQPLLSGHQEYVEPDPAIARLESENRALKLAISQLEMEVTHAKDEATRAVMNLRRTLSPLFNGLRAIFGEMDAIAPPMDNPSEPRVNQKWESIKSRLPPRQREAIDILLLQGSMKRTQLASALKMDYSNCTKNVVTVLKSQGWIVETGGNLSLKQL